MTCELLDASKTSSYSKVSSSPVSSVPVSGSVMEIMLSVGHVSAGWSLDLISRSLSGRTRIQTVMSSMVSR
ncbi:hypothetical protein DVH05_014851, partial [Phytophthora capsici]